MGAPIWAVGATSAVAAAAAGVVSALLVVLTVNAFAADAPFGSVTFADGWVAAATEVACDDDAVVNDALGALMVAECFEFDSLLVGVDVGPGVEVAGGVLGCAGSAASPEAAGSVDFGSVSAPPAEPDAGAAGAPDSLVPLCAPPLLLTVTPNPTSLLDDVVPDELVVPVADVSVPIDVDPLVDVEPPLVVVEVEVPAVLAADPVVDSPADVALAELVEDDSEDVPVVSAAASP
jgi:hypothetical protein